jgi:hypothetical protein
MMKKLITTISLAACLMACGTPAYHYEYRAFDKKEDARLETTEGHNKVFEERQSQGWELVYPDQARPGSPRMLFRRKVRD